MHKLLESWIIYLAVLFLNTSHSFISHKNCWRNCTGPTLGEFPWPNRERYQFRLNAWNMNEITLQCIDESKSIKYIDLLPRINIFQCNSFTIIVCNRFTEVYNILNKLNVTALKGLDYNNIFNENVTITKELFKNLQDLEKLSFSFSRFKFSNDFLRNAPNLTFLELKSVGLSEVNMQFNYIPKLQYLGLELNEVASISDGTFRYLHNLKFLYLNSNNISTISKKIFDGLSSLQILELQNNKIEKLGKDTFADLVNLQKLSLAGNNIKKLYDTVFIHNGQLDTIMLRINKLEDLPANIFSKCKKLKELHINANLISSLPDEIFKGLERLETLDISSNKLTALTQNIFSTLISLESLNMSNNTMLAINMSLFRNLRKLKELDLHHNMISNIEDEASFDLNNEFNEVIINLSNNNITDYPKISGMNVTTLDLSYNSIEYIRVRNLFSNPIPHIDLSHNRIKQVDFSLANHLPEQIMNYSTPQSSINLQNNPIECGCSNYDLIGYNNELFEELKVHIKIQQEGLNCSKYEKKLMDLKPADIDCPVLYDCPDPCYCSYKPYNGEITVNCSSRNLTVIPHSLKNYTYLVRRNFSTSVVRKEDTIQYLDLSDNFLTEIEWIPEFIKELNLNGNRIKNLDHSSITTLKNCRTLQRLHLKNNPWECNCQSLDLQNYLMEHYYIMANSSDVYCQNAHSELINIKNICPKSFNVASILAYILGILFCFTTLFAIYYRYRKQINNYLFKKNLCLRIISEEELDKDKKYDVFISYATQDEEFVMNKLLCELEKGDRPLKVCIHLRDWIPGELISRQIFNSVKESRKTIVVLSNHFMESTWGKLEFRAAHSEAVSKGRSKIILILYEDIDENNLDQELKHYLKANTYIKWGDPFFWKKLNNALAYHGKEKTILQLNDNNLTQRPSLCKSNSNPIIMDPSLLHCGYYNTS